MGAGRRTALARWMPDPRFAALMQSVSDPLVLTLVSTAASVALQALHHIERQHAIILKRALKLQQVPEFLANLLRRGPGFDHHQLTVAVAEDDCSIALAHSRCQARLGGHPYLAALPDYRRAVVP